MTSLTPSPLMVALMQTATSLPVFHGRITIPELVTRPDLLGAVTLNGVGVNLARAVGPALGSIVVAAAGLGAVFLLNVEYRIDPERSLEFTKAMQALSVSGRRDGAIRWVCFTIQPIRAVISKPLLLNLGRNIYASTNG